MYDIPRLPDKLFLVRVPIVATYSEAEIELLGLPVTYNSFGNYNQEAYRELTTCMLPLSKIIDIYISNFPIYIVNHGDIEIIHQMLVNYLNRLEYDNIDPNVSVKLEDRVEDIEKFAMEMFNINLRNVRRKPQPTFAQEQIPSLPRLSQEPVYINDIQATAQLVDKVKPDNRQTVQPTLRHNQMFTLEQPVYGEPLCSQNTYYVPLPTKLPTVDVSSAYDGLPTIDPTKH